MRLGADPRTARHTPANEREHPGHCRHRQDEVDHVFGIGNNGAHISPGSSAAAPGFWIGGMRTRFGSGHRWGAGALQARRICAKRARGHTMGNSSGSDAAAMAEADARMRTGRVISACRAIVTHLRVAQIAGTKTFQPPPCRCYCTHTTVARNDQLCQWRRRSFVGVVPARAGAGIRPAAKRR